jgi:hypothetical protein
MKPKLRFEVFKRDGFHCQYCGRTVPDVTLQADHIIPQADGGVDDIDNLITACTECNQGKGRVPLESLPERLPMPDPEDARERALQLHEYFDYQRDMAKVLDEQADYVLDRWREEFQEIRGFPQPAPSKSSVRRFLKALPLDKLLEAIDIVESRGNMLIPEDRPRYWYGILHKYRRAGEEAAATRIAGSSNDVRYSLDEE